MPQNTIGYDNRGALGMGTSSPLAALDVLRDIGGAGSAGSATSKTTISNILKNVARGAISNASYLTGFYRGLAMPEASVARSGLLGILPGSISGALAGADIAKKEFQLSPAVSFRINKGPAMGVGAVGGALYGGLRGVAGHLQGSALRNVHDLAKRLAAAAVHEQSLRSAMFGGALRGIASGLGASFIPGGSGMVLLGAAAGALGAHKGYRAAQNTLSYKIRNYLAQLGESTTNLKQRVMDYLKSLR